MALITWPTTIYPRSCSLRLAPVTRAFGSPYGGSEQVVDLLNDRWVMSLELEAAKHADIAPLEAFINAMRGQTNTVALYHWGRQTPRGTLASGTVAVASQGASSVSITGTGTLKAGDMVGVPISGGTLLVQVASDVTLSGATSVSLVNRLRAATTAGAITLTRPTAAYRLINRPGVNYIASFSERTTLEFAEAI